MASFIYPNAKLKMLGAEIDLDGHTFKALLLDSGHVPNSANTQLSNITGDELPSSGNYARVTLQNVTLGLNGTSVKFDASDLVWNSATFDASYLVIYDDTHADDLLLCLFDFGGSKSVSNGTFSVQFSADGIIVFT